MTNLVDIKVNAECIGKAPMTFFLESFLLSARDHVASRPYDR